MAVFTAEMRELTKQLIQTITGFETWEDNFKLCFQFAKSNFRFHRFLGVNDLKISRTIRGLSEKFLVHSQPEKAAALEKLTLEFLDSDLEKNSPKSDAHYGVLLLLLCLSDSPVRVEYTPWGGPQLPQEEVDTFDWASYLMEGIEYPSYGDSDSEWSEEESSEEEEEEEREEEEVVEPTTKVDLNDSAVGEELHEGLEDLRSAESQSWLQEHVTIPYWDPSNPLYAALHPPPPSDAHPACNLAANWMAYKQHMEPFYCTPEPTILSETQIIRETLWVLLGAEGSFVYCFTEEGVAARRGVQVSHLTPLALQRQLEHFAHVANLLHQMRRFIHTVTSPDCWLGEDYPLCQTYEAFADALIHCLEAFSEKLRRIEKSIVDKKEFVSLLSLNVELRPSFREIQGIYDVFAKSILRLQTQGGGNPPPYMCSSQVLTVLWDSLQYYDTMGHAGAGLVRLLFPLWVLSVRPYVAMVESWMTKGALSDRHQEFCVQRNPEVAERSPGYWEKGFGLRESLPGFLHPMIDKVMLAGKSMQLLQSIGKLKHSSPAHPATPPDLYNAFLQSLKAELPTRKGGEEEEDEEDGEGPSPTPDPTVPCPPTAVVMEILPWSTDPLMRFFLSSLHTSPPPLTPSPHNHNPSKTLWHDLQAITESTLQAPLTLVIQNSLYPLLHRRYLKGSGALVEVLKTECRLHVHFRTIQLFFLMEAGITMHHFCSDIFQRIQDREPWQDPSYLNSVLQEAIQIQYPSVEHLSVQANPATSSHQVSIHSITALSLHYKMQWPLDTIFSEVLMETYTAVFHLLLQVKWAKWSLESIRTRACDQASLPREVGFKLHLLHLLRAKLLQFVNSLNNYLMTRILHSVGLEFQRNIAEAEDLNMIISLHKEYVTTIFDRCLLNKKASYVKEAIMKILSLTLSFHQKWEEGVAKFSFAEAERIETEFSKCSHFLVTCLNNTVKRGSFPHLETLAFSLRTLKSGERIFTSKTRVL